MPNENPTPSAGPKPPSRLSLWAQARERQASGFIENTVTSVRDGISELFEKMFEVENIDKREMIKSVLFTGGLATVAVTGTIA